MDDSNVALTTENGTDRGRDIGRRERCRRDLIEERLEEMVIVLVDEGDPDRRGELARFGLSYRASRGVEPGRREIQPSRRPLATFSPAKPPPITTT